MPLTDLHWSLGLPGGPHNVLRKDDIPANRVVLLRDHEAQAISAATGVPVPTLHSMTMARYEQRAIMIDQASRRVSLRAMWGRGRGSRYCPGCLADTGGRWQLRWRLTWSFACTTHQRLLADTCPACDSIPGFRASESHLPPSPGYCEAPVPLPEENRRPGWRRHRRCGTDLARTATLEIPPGHPVLAAQRVFDELIDCERRRHLDYAGLLPDAGWEDIRLRTERADHLQLSRRLAPYARHVLFTKLSGLPFTRAPFPRPGNGDRFKNRLAAFVTSLTPELAAELTRVAEEFLIHHQIRDEPPAWQPPAKLLDGLNLPGPDLASVDLSEIHALVRAGGASAAAVARRLGTTSDAVQSLLLDHPAHADPAGGARRRRARYDISREQLRDLHHGQGLSFTEIAQRTGYSRTAIKDLARTYGIPMVP